LNALAPYFDHPAYLWIKTIGKLGGQNKVPRLSNDRKIADQLHQINA
jgi:hypothetical protein